MGCGDISPQAVLLRVQVAVVINGCGIIAVPTEIITEEIAQATRRRVSTHACSLCGAEGHGKDALYCKYYGVGLWCISNQIPRNADS